MNKTVQQKIPIKENKLTKYSLRKQRGRKISNFSIMIEYLVQDVMWQLMLQLSFVLVLLVLISRSKGIYEAKQTQDKNYFKGLINEIKKPKNIAWLITLLPFLYIVKTLLSIYWIHDYRSVFFQQAWNSDYILSNPSIDDFLYIPLIAIYFTIYFPFNGLLLKNKADENDI